jgi:hypothetical protein
MPAAVGVYVPEIRYIPIGDKVLPQVLFVAMIVAATGSTPINVLAI